MENGYVKITESFYGPSLAETTVNPREFIDILIKEEELVLIGYEPNDYL